MVLPGKIMVFYSWIRRFIHDLPPVSRSVSTSLTSPTSSIQIRPLTGRQQSDVPQQLGEVYTASARLGSHAPNNQRCVWVLGISLICLGPLYLLQLICATLIYTVFWFFDVGDPHVYTWIFEGWGNVVPRKTTQNRSGGLRFDIFGGSRETPPAMNFLVAFCCLGGGNKNWSDFFSISSS